MTNHDFMKRFDALTTNQLQQICNSVSANDMIDELVESLPQVEELKREQSMLLESVRMLAENNWNRKPELEQNRRELEKLVNESLFIKQSIQERESRLMEIIPVVLETQDSMDAILLASAAEADDDSENIARSFLGREFGSYDTFLKLFLDKRKLAHLRRAKVDKFLQRFTRLAHKTH